MRKKSGLKTIVPDNWKRWIAENKMLGIDDAVLIETLTSNGFDKKAAIKEVTTATSHPYTQAVNPLLEKVRKYEAIFDLQTALAAQSPDFGHIECRRDLSSEDFLQQYYSKNRPVVLIDLMQNWKALSLWNPQYLKDNFGNETIEIQIDRNSDPLYEENSDLHKKKILFSEYANMVTTGGECNDYYMTANNHVLETGGMSRLLDDVEIFPQYLRPNHNPGEIFFWFGPAGTITPLHHDRQNILVAQVYGRKLIKLIPPTQTHLVYNHKTVFSQIDCENPNYEKYPQYERATVIEGILSPGQALFLPNGWWHYVRALDISITVTFTNFAYDNPVFNW